MTSDRPARCPWCTNTFAASVLAWHMDRCAKRPDVTPEPEKPTVVQCDYGSDRDSGWCEQPSAFTVRGDGTEGESCAGHLAWTIARLGDDGNVTVAVTRKAASQ